MQHGVIGNFLHNLRFFHSQSTTCWVLMEGMSCVVGICGVVAALLKAVAVMAWVL